MYRLYRTVQGIPRLGISAHPALRASESFLLRRSRYSRWTSTNADNIGISKSEEQIVHEGMLYLDNTFPYRVHGLDIRQVLFQLLLSEKNIEARVKRDVLPKENEMPYNFTVTDVIARTRDGGALVRFNYTAPPSRKMQALTEVSDAVKVHLSRKHPIELHNLLPVKSHVVRGQPFVEDIVTRYPSTRLRIEFSGPDLMQETIFEHFRPFGLINDIQFPSPPPKDIPHYVIVQYTRMRSATSARNCLHGVVLDRTRLSISYEHQTKVHVIRDWIFGNPRISLPVIAASLAGFSYAVFDPLRRFNITNRVTRRFNIEEYKLYRWLRRETWARIVPSRHRHSEDEASPEAFADGQVKLDRLKGWLRETPETFIVVTGPPGSGKSTLVKHAMSSKRTKIVLNGNALMHSRNTHEMLNELARQLGYFPVFTWMVNMSGMIESLVGSKSNVSKNADGQVKDILQQATLAIHDLLPEEIRGHGEKVRELRRKIGQDGITEEIEIQFNSDDIPVVVIDGFMDRVQGTEQEQMWENLAEWAALLVENRIAQVIFIARSPAVSKTLAKALPSRTFEYISLNDATPDMAMSFVRNNLSTEKQDLPGLEASVSALGGRLTDLELFVQKVRSGQSPSEAIHDIVQKTLIEIRKYAIGDDKEERARIKWTPVMFWTVVCKLCEGKGVASYDEIRLSSFFNGDDDALRGMENAELIAIQHRDGRPYAIYAGKPVYLTAFYTLMDDKAFVATMDIQANQMLLSKENEHIKQCESEIKTLSELYTGRPPREVQGRLKYLLREVQEGQNDIEKYTRAISNANEIITGDQKLALV